MLSRVIAITINVHPLSLTLLPLQLISVHRWTPSAPIATLSCSQGLDSLQSSCSRHFYPIIHATPLREGIAVPIRALSSGSGLDPGERIDRLTGNTSKTSNCVLPFLCIFINNCALMCFLFSDSYQSPADFESRMTK